MLALQLQGCSNCIMGLRDDATPAQPSIATQVEQTIADRVAAIRAKMIQLGIPVAVGTGVVTMLAFAGAFGLARTERVWTPSIWLGALTTIGGLIGVATAAKATSDAATTAAATSTTTATTPTPATTPTATSPAANPAALGRFYY